MYFTALLLLLYSIPSLAQHDNSHVDRRQIDMPGILYPEGLTSPEAASSGLIDMLKAAANGTAYKFTGDPRATTATQYLAKLYGATRESTGNLPKAMLARAAKESKGYGVVIDPAGAAPIRFSMNARQSVRGSESVKLRYGPYKVPSQKVKNSSGQYGMLASTVQKKIEKPCKSGKCTIIGMSAGLEYANDTNANIDSGLWLHHMVLLNEGPGREDAACADVDISLPHLSINSTSRQSERFFPSGNERMSVVFPNFGFKDVGYRINEQDVWASIVELMNENNEDAIVYVTVTFDIVEGHPYADDVKMFVLDLRPCGTSEVNPPVGKTQFVLSSTQTARIEGDVMGFHGHLHDGGTRAVISVDGKSICNSTAAYGERPEYIGRPMVPSIGGHNHGSSMKHLSSMSECSFSNENGNPVCIRKGQTWTIDAHYDLEKHMGMQHGSNELEAIMGMASVYVRHKLAPTSE